MPINRSGVPTLVAVSEETAGLYPKPKAIHRPVFDTWCAALVVTFTSMGALVLGWRIGMNSAHASCSATPKVRTWLIGAPFARSLLSADGHASWRLRSSNGTIDVPANVPCVAHEALLDAGVLGGDLMYRDRERALQWVALEDWTFEASFVLEPSTDAALLAGGTFGSVKTRSSSVAPAAFLVLEEVDTLAAVSLNGHTIARTESAFLRYELPLRPGLLRPGRNTLTFAFTSALTAAKKLSTGYPYVVPHTKYYNVWSEPSHR